MSLKENQTWLESAQERFALAIAEENIALAKYIIADVLEFGFLKEGQEMNNELREAVTINFHGENES